MKSILFISALAFGPSCAGFGYGAPTLESVVGRIDITRAIECAKQPTAADKARCIGVSLLTDGLSIALDEAARAGAAALAAASGAGADDLSDGDRARLAREADDALDHLGAEISAANAVEG